MKTIEERAKEFIPDAVNPDEVLPAREAFMVGQQRIAYILGAREQKAIDIETACEWLNENARHLLSAEMRRKFHKAMEE